MEENNEKQNGDQQQRLPVQVNMSERGLAPRDMNELWKFSNMIAGSDLAPKQYIGKPANVAVAIEMGMELGLRPMQALQNIAVVNGRPSIYGDAALALVKNSGLCRSHREHFVGEPYEDNFRAVVTTQRIGEEPHVEEFSVADAKRADLWNKSGPWKQYPRRMLQMRARGFALRNVYPDVLLGTLTSEEAGDYIETTATRVEPSPADPTGSDPKPASRAEALHQRISQAKAAAQEPSGEMPSGGPMPGEEAKAPVAKSEAKPEPEKKAQPRASRKAENGDAAPTIQEAAAAYNAAQKAGIDAQRILMETIGQRNFDDLGLAQLAKAVDALRDAVAGLEPPDDDDGGQGAGAEQAGMFD